MTSTISLNKDSGKFRGFKETYIWALKKQLGTMGLLGILLFIGYPVVLLVYMMNTFTNSMENMVVIRYAKGFENYVSAVVPVGVTPLCLLFSVLLAISLFRYIHNKRSVDFFHAVPVRREVLLMGRFLAGETVLLVPLLLVFLIAAAIGAAYGALSVGIVWVMVKQFLWLVLMLTASFSFCMLMMICSGTTFDAVISVLGISTAYPTLVFCCIALMSLLMPGYSIQDNIPLVLITALSPVAATFVSQIGSLGNRTDAMFPTGAFLIWWLVFTAVLITASILLYNRRKSETAENNFAFPLPKHIIRFMLTAAAGTGFGLILYTIHDNSYNFYIGLLIGSFGAHVVTEALYNRGFRNLKKGLLHYAAFLVVFSLFYGALIIGGLGYVSHVPNAQEVEGVYFKGNEGCPIYYEKILQDGQRSYNDTAIYPEMKSKEAIHQTIIFHQRMVDVYTANRTPFQLQHSTGNTYELEYHLKNGKIIHREYSEPRNQTTDDNSNTLRLDQNIVTLKDFKKTNNILFYLEPEYITKVEVAYAGKDKVDDGYITGYRPSEETKRKLLEAIKKDVLENEMQVNDFNYRNGANVREIRICCNSPFIPKKGSALNTLIGDYSGGITLNDSSYLVDSNCKNTQKLLKELQWESE